MDVRVHKGDWAGYVEHGVQQVVLCAGQGFEQGERAKRASLDEDENTSDESREMAADIMATSTTKPPRDSLHSFCSCFIKNAPPLRSAQPGVQKDIGNRAFLETIFSAMYFHTGTAAFGSLLIAIVQFLRAIFSYIQKKMHSMDANGGLVKAIR